MASITRTSVPALDAILGDEISLLDHGHVRVIDYMGDDGSIVQAARVSYGEGTKTLSEDETLIRYLLRHRHTTPFEMCELKLHMRLPIFVARQLIRHRTANVNEYSARYSVVPDLFYIPSENQIRAQSTVNKQGRGEPLSLGEARRFQEKLLRSAKQAYHLYEEALTKNVARELARLHLPVNVYTEWYWKIDLNNLFKFQSLRHDPHAQWEIREYAGAIDDIIQKWVPMAHRAYVDYVKTAHTFSGPEMALLRNYIGDEPGEIAFAPGMSKREQVAFVNTLWRSDDV